MLAWWAAVAGLWASSTAAAKNPSSESTAGRAPRRIDLLSRITPKRVPRSNYGL